MGAANEADLTVGNEQNDFFLPLPFVRNLSPWYPSSCRSGSSKRVPENSNTSCFSHFCY